MKASTRNQAKGKIREIKGIVKEQAGKLGKNPKMTVTGKVDKQIGKAQQVIGKVEKRFGV